MAEPTMSLPRDRSVVDDELTALVGLVDHDRALLAATLDRWTGDRG